MTEIVLYTHPFSNGRVVRWLLEEIGVPYRVEIIDLNAPERPAAFLAMNPMGKVPVLRHGDTIITETAAICAWLADAFPEAGLAPPPGSPARGDYYRWLFFTAGPFDTATTLATMDFTQPAFGNERAPWGSLDKVLATLEIVLADRDHLAGGRVSAADIYLGSLLEWAMRFGVVAPRPVFTRWCDGLFARPAARRAEAIDEALFRGPGLTLIPGGRAA